MLSKELVEYCGETTPKLPLTASAEQLLRCGRLESGDFDDLTFVRARISEIDQMAEVRSRELTEGAVRRTGARLELPRFRGQVVVLVCDSRLLDVHRSYQQCSLPPQAAEALRFS